MSVSCPDCGEVASYGREIGHRSDCPSLRPSPSPAAPATEAVDQWGYPIQRGPCVVCGAVNYSLSMGGPTICPSCDCGDFGLAKVQHQAKEIVELREANEALRRDLGELREALKRIRPFVDRTDAIAIIDKALGAAT